MKPFHPAGETDKTQQVVRIYHKLVKGNSINTASLHYLLFDDAEGFYAIMEYHTFLSICDLIFFPLYLQVPPPTFFPDSKTITNSILC